MLLSLKSILVSILLATNHATSPTTNVALLLILIEASSICYPRLDGACRLLTNKIVRKPMAYIRTQSYMIQNQTLKHCIVLSSHSFSLEAITSEATSSAISKSCCKSSTSSSPTLSRNNPIGLVRRSGGSMDALCSIKVSVPPKLVALRMVRTAPATAIAQDSLFTSKLNMPPYIRSFLPFPCADICCIASSCCGWHSSPG
mmetsp:Transcript_11917/g.25389  ORF Transcript_11917/g.25389 Transcript_11917/m.25389 type:complete len:201 (-) Transcript_11917:1494-2096(-)